MAPIVVVSTLPSVDRRVKNGLFKRPLASRHSFFGSRSRHQSLNRIPEALQAIARPEDLKSERRGILTKSLGLAPNPNPMADEGDEREAREEASQPSDGEEGIAEQNAGAGEAEPHESEEQDESESDEYEDEDGDEEEEAHGMGEVNRAAFQKLAGNLDKVKVRVHDITIKGNVKTKDWVIEALLERVKSATTMEEILAEASKANVTMQRLGCFDKCEILLDAGPKELPGTTNIVVEVEEARRPFSCDFGAYTKPQNKSWTLEGTLKWRNLLGYGETWDGTGTYGFDSTSETSAGVQFPRFRGWGASMFARASLLTQDWHKYSSYNGRFMGISVGLLNDKNHELSYGLTWRHLSDPSHRASKSVRNQLGHDLLSSLKYSFKHDRRDSTFRPTRGYAFGTSFQIAGLGPDDRLSRFVKQEVDIRLAFPLGFLNSAINVGASAGVLIPWAKNKTTPISDRFFIGGNTSLVGDMRGPCSLLGFRTRGIGPTAMRRLVKLEDAEATIGRDAVGADLAVTGFLDLSFDLPFVKVLKDYNIHAHAFVCAGNLVSLPDKSATAKSLLETARCSTGFGLVVPTKLFRIEVNYCHILQHQEDDRLGSGIQFSFSSG